MAGAAILCIEVDPDRIARRLEHKYLMRSTDSLDEALRWLDEARKEKRALSVGLTGDRAEVLPELVRRKVIPRHHHGSDFGARSVAWICSRWPESSEGGRICASAIPMNM